LRQTWPSGQNRAPQDQKEDYREIEGMLELKGLIQAVRGKRQGMVTVGLAPDAIGYWDAQTKVKKQEWMAWLEDGVLIETDADEGPL
jgi:hypothetical protein